MRETLVVGAVIGGLASLLFLVERFIPLRRARHPLAGRLIVNLAFALIAFATVTLAVRPAAVATLAWTGRASFGLLHLLALPEAARPLLAFLLMDLTFYWWHRANHRIRLLWRFHNVHHIDPDLDVTTAFRFHFGELVFSSAFRVVQIGLIGPSLWAYAAYELVFQAGTLFHHSNVRLPIRLERLLNRVLVTPRMHGIHHSQVMTETNSNYSTVLPWWDRLHSTLGLNVPQAGIEIGIPAYARVEDNRLWNAIAIPFRRQRSYWRREDGATDKREKGGTEGDTTFLAE
ncbi:sterol desaturase family protein [Geobacter sp.]|uniref:sterol desaturase family protein n=1 Tax=Geobacter sp. TaxID=46610 RepID=UPI00260EBDA7|nr:sterol desaturase family protein [Geobacter sp.]